jgi:hypothetical protein
MLESARASIQGLEKLKLQSLVCLIVFNGELIKLSLVHGLIVYIASQQQKFSGLTVFEEML